MNLIDIDSKDTLDRVGIYISDNYEYCRCMIIVMIRLINYIKTIKVLNWRMFNLTLEQKRYTNIECV